MSEHFPCGCRDEWAVCALDASGCACEAPSGQVDQRVDATTRNVVIGVASISAVASAYHGYKRNQGSVGWGAAWALAGLMFPVITPAVAVAQGFAEPHYPRE